MSADRVARLQGHEVVIVEAVRTPIGRGHRERGWFKDLHPADLLGNCYTELLRRARVDPSDVDDVIAGCAQQFGVQAANIARTAWLGEGLPVGTPATTVDRACGSSQQAVNFAASAIACGAAEVVVAGGVEAMSSIDFADGDRAQEIFGRAYTERMLANHEFVGQGLGAELIAQEYEISRLEMDELGVQSHRRAAAATETGAFAREIIPIEVEGASVVHDQGIRADTTLEAASQLRPAFKPDGRITAASSSQISDGASAVLMMSRAKCDRLGLVPRARVLDHVAVGVDPTTMLKGPIPATTKILERNRMSIDDIDYFECNEAFAAVVIAWAREHNPDMDRVNARGGAMALGHPPGCTGARLVTTLLHELEDEDAELGFVTMCCGGGFGTGTLIQRM